MRRGSRLVAALVAAGVAAVMGAGFADAAAVSAKITQKRLVVTSLSGDSRITLRLRPGHPAQLVVDADADGDADFRFERTRFRAIVVNGGDGNDVLTISERNGVFTTLERTTLAGGSGADTLVGGTGSEKFIGGAGADTVEGRLGPDSASLGKDDDVFKWTTGDGKDVVEGHDGFDRLSIEGLAAGESFGLRTNGARFRLARNANAKALDADGIERVDVLPLGGSDTVAVNDLTGTDVTQVNVDFGPADGFVNQLTLYGTTGDDVAVVAGDVTGVLISGLAAVVDLSHTAPNDRLRVNVLAGSDVIDGSGLSSGALFLTEDGGDGDDVLLGSAGADVIFGGAGDDVLVGGPGVDVLDGGPGDNVVIQD